jgi:hypothetical protein
MATRRDGKLPEIFTGGNFPESFRKFSSLATRKEQLVMKPNGRVNPVAFAMIRNYDRVLPVVLAPPPVTFARSRHQSFSEFKSTSCHPPVIFLTKSVIFIYVTDSDDYPIFMVENLRALLTDPDLSHYF